MKHTPFVGLVSAASVLVLFGAGCNLPAPLSSLMPGSSPSTPSYSTQYAASTSTLGTTATTTAGQVTPPLQSLDVTFVSDNLRLHGYLSKPPGDGPFPAILYNHGSEVDPAPNTAAVQYFVSQGYVVFEPLRRGHGQSEGTDEADLANNAPAGTRQQVVVDSLNNEIDDVTNGLNYLKALPYVDKDKLAVAGCSYGGVMTLLAAQQPNTGLKVAVDFAGASESWGNTLLQMRMKQAVDKATVPVFFLQAQNDYDTSPTTVLSQEMTRVGKSNKAKIYPAVGTTPQEGHAGFCFDSPQLWGADVVSYIQSYTK